MKTYIYIARGYSFGGWGGYSKITVSETNEKEPSKSWTNKKMNVLERTGRLFDGETIKSEFSVELRRILNEYPNSVIIK